MKKGVVLEMYKSSVAVLTPNGEFLKIRKDGILCEIGEEIWFHEADIIVPGISGVLNKLGKITIPRYVVQGLTTAVMMLTFLPSAIHSEITKEAGIDKMVESLLNVFGNDPHSNNSSVKKTIAMGMKKENEKKPTDDTTEKDRPEGKVNTTSRIDKILETSNEYDEESTSNTDSYLFSSEDVNFESTNDYYEDQDQGLLTYTDFSTMKTFVTFPQEINNHRTEKPNQLDQPLKNSNSLKPIELAVGNTENKDLISDSLLKVPHTKKNKEKVKDIIDDVEDVVKKPAKTIANNDIPKKPHNDMGNSNDSKENKNDSHDDNTPISTPGIKDEYVGADTWGDSDDSSKSENPPPPPSSTDEQIPSVDPNEPDDTPTVTPPKSDIDMNATCQKDGYYVEYETILTFEKNANGEIVEVPKQVPIKKYCEAPSTTQPAENTPVSDEKNSDPSEAGNTDALENPPSTSYDPENTEKPDPVEHKEEPVLPSESFEYTPSEESLTFQG